MTRRDLQGFEPAGLVVEVTEIIIHEADQPNPLVGLFDPDGLAGEDLAEIDFLPIEADSSAGGDSGSPVMEGIFDVRQASIGPRRRTVSLRGTLHVEGLVGPLVVVAIDEVVELGLLLQEVAGGWSWILRPFLQTIKGNGMERFRDNRALEFA